MSSLFKKEKSKKLRENQQNGTMETNSKHLLRHRVEFNTPASTQSTMDTQQQLREKETLIKKLAVRLHQAEKNVRELVSERRSLLRLFNDLVRTTTQDASRSQTRVAHLNDSDDDEQHYDDGLLGSVVQHDKQRRTRRLVLIDDADRLVPMFRRPGTDGDVLLLSEQYLTLLTRKCHLIKR